MKPVWITMIQCDRCGDREEYITNATIPINGEPIAFHMLECAGCGKITLVKNNDKVPEESAGDASNLENIN